MLKYKVPELLAPAGNFEKLKTAIAYGANAVYLAGQKLGLRSAADNFSSYELPLAVKYAHDHGVKAYITLNSFLFDSDLGESEQFLRFLKEISVDAVIVSDLGMAKLVSEIGGINLHVSTQASVNNSLSATLWKKLGATRLILGREVSIEEAKNIKIQTDLEVEIFVHGSMCMAYSGNCVISNYTQGRDSNRGGCAHSCRFEYKVETSRGPVISHFMSSKDLKALAHLESIITSGIDSIKIEGRMKSELYAATTSKVYSTALKYYEINQNLPNELLEELSTELEKVPHRAYTDASMIHQADASSVFDERDGVQKGLGVIAQVVHNSIENGTILEVRRAFNRGDKLEVVTFSGKNIFISTEELKNIEGLGLERSKPSSLVKLPYHPEICVMNLVRSDL